MAPGVATILRKFATRWYLNAKAASARFSIVTCSAKHWRTACEKPSAYRPSSLAPGMSLLL